LFALQLGGHGSLCYSWQMKLITNLFSEEQLAFNEKSHGIFYSGKFAEISRSWGAQKLGFHLEILDPGKFSCPYHRHQEEEELFLALRGSSMVRQDNQIFKITEGDLVFFKTGTAHQFYNHTNSPFHYFALSNDSKNDICEFPDSNKVWNRNKQTLTQNGLEVSDYWKDEEDPALNWPAEMVQG